MSTFGLTVGSSGNDIIGALNYALANLGTGGTNTTTSTFTVNTGTGQVFAPGTGVVFSYLYQYLFLAYADSADGATGFSQFPTDKLYYGVRNSAVNAGSDSNPADYIWYEAAGGFGTDKLLYLSVAGGGIIYFNVTTASPGVNWIADQGGGYVNGIDLTIITNITTYPSGTIPSAGTYSILAQDGAGNSFWVNSSGLAVNSANASFNAQAVTVTPAQYFASPTILELSMFEAGTGVSYADPSVYYSASNNTVTNFISAPSIKLTQVINLKPQLAQPAIHTTGTIAVADRVHWDPAGVGSGNPYVAFYNGVSWVKLG